MDHSPTGDAPGADASGVPPGLENEQIYGRIFEAIVDHKLLPGTHLKEDELCAIFGIGRTRVRTILARLAADHIVELVANRGAFVSRPTVEEAREVFRARRLVECHLVRRVAENPGDQARRMLRHHLDHEQEARDAGDQGIVIRRCGNFHQVLGDLAGSPVVARFLRELIARSSLIVAVYEAHAPDECEFEEHRRLTELVLAGEADAAAELMDSHLRGIEGRLDLKPKKETGPDLRATFLAGH